MEDCEIPDAALKAVARRLKRYMTVERPEEGFDLSGSTNLKGGFCSGRGLGGTYHYNSLQDKHMHHYLQNPLVRNRLESIGGIHKGMLQEMDEMVKKNHRQRSALIHNSKSSKQRQHQRTENSHLLENTAKVLIQEHSFIGVASVETMTSDLDLTNENESGTVSRLESYSFSQYSPVDHSTPRKQASSCLEGAGKLSKKGAYGGDNHGKLSKYSSPPPTPSLHVLTTSTNTSQKSDVSHDTPSCSHVGSITPSRESPFTSSQEISITPSRESPIMASHKDPIMATQEDPILTSHKERIIASQEDPITPSQENPTLLSATAPHIPPQMYQENTAYPLTHMVPLSMFQQGHTQPRMFGPSTNMQAYTYPESQEGRDIAPLRQKCPVVVMKDACISTINTVDASTQTPVHAETQTDKSALYKLSEKQRKKQAQKIKSVSSKPANKTANRVGRPELQTVPNSYSQTSKYDPSRAAKKDTSTLRKTSISDKSAKPSTADIYSDEESSSSMSSYSSRRSKSKGKHSSQTEIPLQDHSAKLSDAVSCIHQLPSASALSHSTWSNSKDDASVLSNATHTIDSAHESDYKGFQEAKKSEEDTMLPFPLPPSTTPSQKGDEVALKVEGLGTTQETLAGDPPLPSPSSIISSQQPPPHVERTPSVAPTPLMAAEETEVTYTPVEYPASACEPLDVTSAPITAVKETELESTSPPLPPPTSPVHHEVSSLIAPPVATKDEGLPIKEPLLSTTSGHSAEVEITKASTTSIQGLNVNDTLLTTEALIHQKNDSASPISPLSTQECQTSRLQHREEDKASVALSSKEPLPTLSSPNKESITTILETPADENNAIVTLQPFSEENQGTLPPSPQLSSQESQSKTFLEVGQDLASVPTADQEESSPFSPLLQQESAAVGVETSSRTSANVPPPKDEESSLPPPLLTTEMSGRSGSQ